MINYAHRGASDYAPENTMAAFYLGEQMGADGIETDIQRTRDGMLVLQHDASLKRTTGLDCSVSELSWAEISRLDAGAWKGSQFTGERMVRLEDLLYFFGGKPIHFALEIKQAGIELDVVEVASRYLQPEQFTVTSFQLDSLLVLAEHCPKVRLGYLTKDFSIELIEYLHAQGIDEYCPNAQGLEVGQAALVRAKGLGIRAWGVKNEMLMQAMIDAGVDGMTVNFPDVLTSALRKRL